MTTDQVPDHVPAQWTLDELVAHVASIVFDGAETVQLDCHLCQLAAVAGLWDDHYDPDDGHGNWLAELVVRAAFPGAEAGS